MDKPSELFRAAFVVETDQCKGVCRYNPRMNHNFRVARRDQVVKGNSKLALSCSIAEIVGPGLTGVLVQLFTASMAILLDALSFLASALTVWLVRKPEPRVVPNLSSQVWEELITGMRAIEQSPIRRAIAGHSATVGIFGGFFASLYVLYMVRDLRLSPALLGAVIGRSRKCPW